jgi:hypothetical protein
MSPWSISNRSSPRNSHSIKFNDVGNSGVLVFNGANGRPMISEFQKLPINQSKRDLSEGINIVNEENEEMEATIKGEGLFFNKISRN